jgi:hypothetical protein
MKQEHETLTPGIYPYLKIDEITGTIVRFESLNTGTCVHAPKGSPLEVDKFYKDCLEESYFEFFNGIIPPSND